MIIQFEQSELSTFETIFDNQYYDSNYLASKRLAGDEILLQVLLTATSIVSPFIIQFFIDQKAKNKQIKLVKKGVELIFETEADLKEYLDTLKDDEDK